MPTDLPFLLDFLRGLAANNNKGWMDANRVDYHRARAAFTGLVAQVLGGLQQVEPGLQGLKPADTMYRINKNDRFQQSDEPYKRRMGAGMSQGGRHSHRAGYFLAVEPGGETYVGAGKWRPEAPSLARIRQEIHYNGPAFHEILDSPELRHHFPEGMEGEKLQRPPKGYDKAEPDIELLKHRDFFVARTFTDQQVLRSDFVAQVLAAFQAAQPFVRFLNQALNEE
ncbi:DUF2461 domain-containing protein [Hymenobacter sp. BT175]|uniref:DUF2461 domain-containing protein n=1 Tax=Hymenobacter translucens TaxID=2886507 RepID=UPI001D0E7B30|nr:DUF2461 domain-containing protein [Hymenobacter translucens]MCC2548158.1 DUF2461 domain-containing protein [Hymenobacter translucens]